jgi:hypothetical protein
MAARTSFERRLTVEEADAARIRVRRALVPQVGALGARLRILVDGRRCDAVLTEDLCACAGPQRPHAHAFLALRGDVRLEAFRRVTVEIEPAAAP